MSQDFWFLLLPGFSVMGFVSAVEPLRVANRFHADLYRWHVLSADGGPVLASNGMSVNSDGALEPLKKGDLLFQIDPRPFEAEVSSRCGRSPRHWCSGCASSIATA